MANGHVEIHDPISNHSGRADTTDSDPKTSPDTDNMEDSPEYRILMAFATRRRSGKRAETDAGRSPVASNGGNDANGTTPSQTVTPTETEEKLERKDKKKKKGWKRLSSILRCVKPQTDDNEQTNDFSQRAGNLPDVNARCFNSSQGEDEDELDEVANRLTKIADEVKLSPPELETDSGDDEVEKVIGLLLREKGDEFDKKLKEANIGSELFSNYSFFERVMNTLLTTTGYRSSNPSGLGPQASQKTQIAVTCEITSRLSAVDTLPMSRLLHHGARYLQAYYSGWVQEQGGYEAAIDDDDDEVE